MKKNTELKKITIVAMLSAVAYLCMFLFKFKVSFLTFDFKDAFLATISFLYGPLYGAISSVLVAFIELISVSDTGPYGFIMNALSSAVFAGTCGLFYKYKRTFSGAILGAVIAVVSMTAIMLVANWLITPYYMGVARSDVAKMIPTLLLPFNLIKGFVNMAITLIIYKPITNVLRKSGFIAQSNQNVNNKKFIFTTVVSFIIILACVLIIFFVFDGSFQLLK